MKVGEKMGSGRIENIFQFSEIEIPTIDINVDLSGAKQGLSDLEQIIDRLTEKTEYLNSLLIDTIDIIE